MEKVAWNLTICTCKRNIYKINWISMFELPCFGAELWDRTILCPMPWTFRKMSWLNMQSVPSMSMCQAGPITGKLGAIAQGKREKRQQATRLPYFCKARSPPANCIHTDVKMSCWGINLVVVFRKTKFRSNIESYTSYLQWFLYSG